MSLLYDGGVRKGRISLNRFVELTSASPAKISAFSPAGNDRPGSDADIVIFDPEKKQTLSAKTLHMKVDYNPYEGREITGAAERSLSAAKCRGSGRFVGKAGPARSWGKVRVMRAHERAGGPAPPQPGARGDRRRATSPALRNDEGPRYVPPLVGAALAAARPRVKANVQESL
jgi:hypothetical protein